MPPHSCKSSCNLYNYGMMVNVYVLLLQAELNPFYTPNTPLTSSAFSKKAHAVARRHLS